ncbi:NADH dehydrogenase [ubiquinone] 1 beta subcomplex subunit 6 [Thamnophis elegans]|uniref:NADH dehydrogenase [ubiquinone] 1 beta subcomplex subunit 6 n=1 Tax=Thamnophis elegans TaxID=35005 RepID=UPI0013790161|nr:NADH dehydrogenase [ubiquinone] 1 beta subcomplex subunit 6 [Thamnophis elegans]
MVAGFGAATQRPPRGGDRLHTGGELRRQQLRELRRRWLKDQELSPRKPVLPPRKLGFVEAFWQRFLQPEKLWKRQVFKIYNAGKFTIINLIIPLWIAHYLVKYHAQLTPHGIVQQKPTIYPGDRVEEKGIPSAPYGTAAEIPFCED